MLTAYISANPKVVVVSIFFNDVDFKVTEMRTYKYVVSDEVRASAAGFSIGTRIQSIDDLKAWINETSQQPDAWGLIPATFVVDAECYLRVADRHSEHIACAGGASIMAAGEIFFHTTIRSLK